MRWLFLLAAIGTAALFVLAVVSERRGGRPPRSRSGARLAWAALSLIALAAGVFVAHWVGIFSVPLVVLAFVPFGVALRWWFTATRSSREREAAARAAAAGRRVPSAAELPIFVGLVAIAVALGVIAGLLVGRH